MKNLDADQLIRSGNRRANYLIANLNAGTGPGGMSERAREFSIKELEFIRAGILSIKEFVPLLEQLQRLTTLSELAQRLPSWDETHDQWEDETRKARSLLDRIDS